MTSSPVAPQPPRPLGAWQTVAWGIALLLGCRAIQLVLEAQSLASLVGQVVLVEWGATRIGLVSSPSSHESTSEAVPTTTLARRAVLGLAAGFVGAALVFGTLWVSRSVVIERVPRFELSLLGIGFVSAALQAWRDEMLIHGVPLAALQNTTVSSIQKVLACGVTSMGAALGRGDATAASVIVAAELGIVFGALWIWDWNRGDRARLAAPAAHVALRWSMETLFSGGLLHGRVAANRWAGGDAGTLGGAAAIVALAPMCIFALSWTAAPRISPRSS